MKHVDIPAVYAALDTRRASLDMSWRDVARATDMSNSTFTRMRTKYIDLDGYAACCRWLGVPLDTFVVGPRPGGTESPEAELWPTLHRCGVPETYWRSLTELVRCLATNSVRL